MKTLEELLRMIAEAAADLPERGERLSFSPEEWEQADWAEPVTEERAETGTAPAAELPLEELGRLLAPVISEEIANGAAFHRYDG